MLRGERGERKGRKGKKREDGEQPETSKQRKKEKLLCRWFHFFVTFLGSFLYSGGLNRNGEVHLNSPPSKEKFRHFSKWKLFWLMKRSQNNKPIGSRSR